MSHHRSPVDPLRNRDGQVSGIAGDSDKFSAGVSGHVKIPIDCTV